MAFGVVFSVFWPPTGFIETASLTKKGLPKCAPKCISILSLGCNTTATTKYILCTWDIVRHGELVLPPHKTWTHDNIPMHAHDCFHPTSWTPLRTRRLAWHKWLFGLQSRKGFDHYATFWANRPSPTVCSVCHVRHNSSVHGVIAHCTEKHPLVSAWLASWPDPGAVANWRTTAHRQDLRIIGRLAVPTSLYLHLRSSLGGARAARLSITRYQATVVDNRGCPLRFLPPHVTHRCVARLTGTRPPLFSDCLLSQASLTTFSS